MIIKKIIFIVLIVMAVLGFGYIVCSIVRLYDMATELAYRDKVRGYDDDGWPYTYAIARYGEDISILVDFSRPSSEHRFFVVDNRTKRVISSSKCAHGSGGGSTVSKPVFSNTPGSNCSSLGKYRILFNDKMHNNNFPCIRLEGLDSSNSNARGRGIVIHEGPVMADDITLGVPIPVSPLISQGCFTISSETFNALQDLVRENKTIYLYAFDSEP